MEAKIKYPRIWEYLIITTNKISLLESINNAFACREYSIKPSKKSKSKNYESFIFQIEVSNKIEKDEIFHKIATMKNVKVII